jgi:fatty-acyl-CoA synthase/long-chain acyl-CoA synthetase
MIEVNLYPKRGVKMEKNKSLLSVYGILKQTCEKYGNKEVIYDENERITYNQMKNDVDLFAGALTNKGIVKGDRVAAALPNWYETVVIFFAVAKIGAVLVPFNPKYKFHEVEYILNNSEPKLLIATEEFEKNVTFKKVLALVPEAITLRFSLTGFQRYEELIQEGSHSEEIPIDSADDLYCLLYTSGTTGMPKGVMLSHQSLIHSAVTIGGEIHGTNEDVFILSAPVFHIFGMGINLFCAVSLGARIVLLEKFQPRQVLHLIQQEKVTIHSGVPTMFIKELEVDDFQSYDLSSLRTGIVGAAPIPANKVKEIRDRLGFNLLQSYGISETSSVTLTPYDDHEQFILETVGRAIPGVEMQIVDENRRPLQPGEIGEIAIKSISSMKGYYKMPEQTAAVLDSAGWYYTGDLGTLDSGGYLRFVGRKKEIIIRGGLNIYPQELEALLTKHPKVMDVAIVGIPDEVFGEIACAVVQLKDGSESTEEEIIEYLKRQIANYKLPNKVFFTKEFPVTPSGKIQKMRLREQIVSEMARPI